MYNPELVDISFIFLFIFAFLAGFIDSMVGGGGLIQLPALLILMPHFPLATAFGTNKLASFAGTAMATIQYARNILIPWRSALFSALAAFCLSFMGARVVSCLNPQFLRPLIIILLFGVAVFTIWKKDFGTLQAARIKETRQIAIGMAAGALIGFYDGFFGPGTGSFLIFIFIAWFGYSFITASASSKIVNLATNLAALIYFSSTNNIHYATAFPMAFFNILGSLVGVKLALLKGSKFIRILFLAVVFCVLVKLIWDTYGGA